MFPNNMLPFLILLSNTLDVKGVLHVTATVEILAFLIISRKKRQNSGTLEFG